MIAGQSEVSSPAASLAALGDGQHIVPLDACIATMRQTGRDMDERLRVLNEAREADEAGCFAIVVEGVTLELAREVTASVGAPTQRSTRMPFAAAIACSSSADFPKPTSPTIVMTPARLPVRTSFSRRSIASISASRPRSPRRSGPATVGI